MWLTPLQVVIAILLVLAVIAVMCINAGGPPATHLRRRHSATAENLKSGQHDFEKEHHLVLPPPVGTPVVLLKDIGYLRDYHGASIGQRGTVVQHSRLSRDDNGVLVDWGVRLNDRVRMDLEEIQLA